MSYATLDDMVMRFGAVALGQVAEPESNIEDGTGQPFDSEKIQAALDDATSVINAYAAGRYAVPLTPVPAPVRHWCADMARYYLCNGAQPGATDPIRKAFEDAFRGLVDMQKGNLKFQADGVPSAEPLAGTGADVRFTGPRRAFTGKSLRGF